MPPGPCFLYSPHSRYDGGMDENPYKSPATPNGTDQAWRMFKFAALAWLQFIVGLVVLGSWNYYVRWRDGWLDTGGSPTPDAVWFGVPLLLGVIAIVLLWHATASVPRFWVRVALVVMHAFVGFALYLVACFWYVTGTGIDSM